MSVFRSADPERDLAAWQKEQQEWEDRLPCCDKCGEKVDDYVYDIDGEILCIECMIAKFRRDVEDYLK